MRLPSIILHAAGSRQDFKLSRLGQKAVLVCHGQDTAKAAFEVNNTVREKYPDADEVLIASIIDLSSFPSMFQGMVKPELDKAYLKAASKLSEGLEPRDYVIILADWDAEATEALEAKGSTKQAVVIVADAKGQVVGRCAEGDLGAAALKFLAEMT